MIDAILFVRHGETSFNRRGLTMGWRNPGLTPTGWRQAIWAAELIGTLGATGIVVGPMRRCLETAQPLAVLSLPTRLDPDFRERGWGTLEGCPKDWRHDAVRVAQAGVEPPEDFAARVTRALVGLTGRSVVVSHSGVFRAISVCLAVDVDLRIGNGDVIILEHRHGKPWHVLPFRSPL